MKMIINIIPALLFFTLLFPLSLMAQEPGERSVELRTDVETPDDSVLDVILGSTPQLATENGLLVIRAYLDSNNNGERELKEQELENQLLCQIDEIEYTVPAFIPGLKYNGNYQITCSGEKFTPSRSIPEVFIAHRGQIIKMDLACREQSISSMNSSTALPH